MIDFERNLVLSHSSSGFLNFDSYSQFISDFSDFVFTEEYPSLILNETYFLNYNDEVFRFELTKYPILIVEASEPVPNEPKIPGRITVIKSGSTTNEYFCGIEYRGQTSLVYEKKSLGIELWNSKEGDEELDVPLLDMRSDGDWIIDAMVIDPLKMRNSVSMKFWYDHFDPPGDQEGAKMGCNSKFVEYFLNGEYYGLGNLMERVDRKQLNLNFYHGTLDGELYKADDWGGVTTFDLVVPFDNNSEWWGGFKKKYPNPEQHINWQNLHEFIDFVANSSDEEFEEQIHDLVDYDNIIDYFIYEYFLC